jgi:hypothetical protein
LRFCTKEINLGVNFKRNMNSSIFNSACNTVALIGAGFCGVFDILPDVSFDENLVGCRNISALCQEYLFLNSFYLICRFVKSDFCLGVDLDNEF